jgi:hypothetical protein
MIRTMMGFSVLSAVFCGLLVRDVSAQVSCQEIGNQTFCSNGQSFQRIGNQTILGTKSTTKRSEAKGTLPANR